VYRNAQLQIWANENLKQYAGPELSEAQFLTQCRNEAKKQREAEVAASKRKYETRLKSLEKKLAKERRELTEDQQEVSARKLEEVGTHLENVLSLFGGRRRTLTTSLTKRRLTTNAQAEVEESIATIAELETDMQELGEEIQVVVEEIHEQWDAAAEDFSQVPVTALKKDIYLSIFGIAWLPFHRVDIGGREVEIPAYQLDQN
jgi:hypothetical protein